MFLKKAAMTSCLTVMVTLATTNLLGEERKQKIDAFDGLVASGEFEIEIVEGKTDVVVLDGDTEDLDKVEVTQEGSTLKFGVKEKSWLGSSPEVKVLIRKSNNKLVSMNLSGEVRVETKMEFESKEAFDINMSGACKVNGNQIVAQSFMVDMSGAAVLEVKKVVAEKADFDLSGANKLSIAGTIGIVKIDGSGATKADLENLKTKRVSLDLSGASKLTLGASDQLDGSLSGASKLRYAGRPKLKVSSSGAASISAL